MTAIDATHDPELRSWVTGANGHPDFPIQNLPLGIFSPPGEEEPRGGVAIGDLILDLRTAFTAELFEDDARRAAQAASGAALNALLAMGSVPRNALRRRLVELLARGSREQGEMERHLHLAADCRMHMAAEVGDYTDFYAGIHHATNVGKLFRPDNPLLPNYKYVPIGYHGRTSSICPSGTPVRRPHGQRTPPATAEPSFGPSFKLDYELELAIWVGPGNALGEPIPIAAAAEHIAGYGLLNDWSARDIQAWEYQPLGPFLSKSFATTVSPWIITPEALAPFRIPQPPRAEGDPVPLPYLRDVADQQQGALNLELEVLLLTPEMRAKGLPPHRLALSNARHMYWTPAQMLTHHASGGCNLQPGDLLGSGTISGPDQAGCGSLLEMTKGGANPVILPSGEQRTFLEEGDEVFLTARAMRDGVVPIGFGECRGVIGEGR